jgi:hypothetical protein
MTPQEEVYVAGWNVIEDKVLELHNKAWSFQKRGKQVAADKLNEAANYHTYLFYYALFLRNWLDRQGLIEDGCTATFLEKNFKIKCVEDNLSCLSINHNTDYVSVWEELITIFGIIRQSEGCETECCLGIGEMVIKGDDSCYAFIVGPCEENETILTQTADYADCMFSDDFDTADEGICDTTKCN